MKELTQQEMEYIAGAGLLDVPCALASFTVQSALGLIKVGIDSGLYIAKAAVETTLDVATNVFNGSPSSLESILVDHFNSLSYDKSGVWSNFVYNAATDWGQVIYAFQK